MEKRSAIQYFWRETLVIGKKLKSISDLLLQPTSEQNDLKLSYYLPKDKSDDEKIATIKNIVKDESKDARITFISLPNKEFIYVDILPT